MRFALPLLKWTLHAAAIAFGVLGIAWGVKSFPVFIAAKDTETMAFHVAANEPFQEDALRAALPTQANSELETRARYLRSLAIIEFRLAELSIDSASDHRLAPERQAALDAALIKALGYEPSDSYLWLIRFWLQSRTAGVTDQNLPSLRMSYAYGPHEGWIAVLRNRLAMGLFSSLPKDIQDEAVTEFTLLVQSGYAEQTAAIVAGPGWPVRQRLLTEVQTMRPDLKQKFATALYALNDTVVIPGARYPAHH